MCYLRNPALKHRKSVCPQTHLPIEDNRVLAVGGGGRVRVGWLGRHGFNGDETQRT